MRSRLSSWGLTSLEWRWIQRWRSLVSDDEKFSEQLTDAGRILPLLNVPPGVRSRAKRAFEKSRNIRWQDAQTIRPWSDRLEASGIRDAGKSAIRSAGFATNDVDLLLDCVYEENALATVCGQVLPLGDEPLFFELELEGPVSLTAETDDLGQFDLGPLAEGSYEMRVRGTSLGVVVRFTVEGQLL